MRKRLQFSIGGMPREGALLLIFGVLATSTPLKAQNQGLSAVQLEESRAAFPLKLDAALSGVSNLERRSSPDYEATAELELIPKASISEKWNSLLYTKFDKQLYDEQKWVVNDAYLQAENGSYELGEGFGYSTSFFGGLPLSKESRRQKSLRTYLTLRPNLTYNFSGLGFEGLSLTYRPSFTKSFHKYTTSSTGESNNSYGLGNRFDLAFGPWKSLTFVAIFSQSNSWTYEGNLRQNFRVFEEVTYAFNPTLSLTLGHNNQGALLKADGASNNVSLYDSRSSTVYLTLTTSI